MEYQYYAQRFRYLPNGRQVGTVHVGDIIYVQDNVRPGKGLDHAICREPWRVEAWIPREATSYDAAAHRFHTVRCAGGHLALLRSLRNSRRTAMVADWILLACVDAGLTR